MNPHARLLRFFLAVLPWGFYGLLLTPGPWQGLLFTPARFKEWVGLPCPLCGGTRATLALFLGDMTASLYLNPLALVVFLGCLLWTAGCLYEACSGRPLLPEWETCLVRSGRWILAGVLAFWFYHAASAWILPKEELLNRNGWVFRR